MRPPGGDGQRPIVAEGSPRPADRRSYSTREVVELRFQPDEHEPDAPSKLADLAERIEVLPDRLLLYTDDGDAAAARGARARSRPGRRAGPARSTLEDVFLRLTGRTLVD